MAGNQTLTVKEADGVTETDVEILGMGRQPIVASKSVALSDEDIAVIGPLNATKITDPDGASASLLALLRGLMQSIQGTVAHDAIDSGNGSKIDMHALAHGTNPTAVAAADRTRLYANRHGIPWVIGGHMNAITRDAVVLDSDGAQTNVSLVGTISAGTKLVVTQISAVCSSANSGNIAVRIGFGAASVPAAALAGAAGILINGTFGPGAGQQKGNGAGIVAIGADGEELRLTCGDPAGGALYVTFTYYTIES